VSLRQRRHVRKLNQLSIRTRVYQNTRRNTYRYVFIYLRYVRSAYVFSFFKQQSSSLRKKRGQVCPKTWRLAVSPVQNKRNIAPLTANSSPEHVTKVSSFTIFMLWINTLVKTRLGRLRDGQSSQKSSVRSLIPSFMHSYNKKNDNSSYSSSDMANATYISSSSVTAQQYPTDETRWTMTWLGFGLSHSKLVTSALSADPKKLEMSIEDRREEGAWLFLRDTLFYHYITMWCSNRYANTCHRSAFSSRRQTPPYLQEQIS